jgi:nucleoside 2-deoxyribosyltransferase
MTGNMTDTPTIYIAGPLFTQAEWLWNEQLAARLRERGFAPSCRRSRPFRC